MNSMKALICALMLSLTATAVQARVLGIATIAPGSSFFAVGTAISNVMERKAGLTSRVQPMSGGSVYMPLINRGNMDFGISTSLDVVNAYKGINDFPGHKNPNLRLVGAVFVIPFAIGVPDDSPIKSIAQLKGKRMPSKFTAQVIVRIVQDAVLGTAGLSTADMKPYPVANYIRGMRALAKGEVDAASFCVGCGISTQVNATLAAHGHGGLRFLPIPNTPQALAALHKVYPGSYLKVIQPAPGLSGIVAPTSTMEYSGFLVTNASMPDDVVYKVTKALYGNKAMLEASTRYMKSFQPMYMAEANAVPYHPGAEKFYKQVGLWPPKAR